MAAVEFPATLLLQVDSTQLPPSPPAPGGIVCGAGSLKFGEFWTASNAFVPTGMKITVDALQTQRVMIYAEGIIGHNIVGGVVQLALAKAGTLVENDEPLAAARSDSDKSICNWALFHEDTRGPTESGPIEYELYMKQSASDPSAKAYLGRRGFVSDTMVIRTVLRYEVLAPAP